MLRQRPSQEQLEEPLPENSRQLDVFAGEDLLPVGDVCPEVAVVHVPVVEVGRVEDPPQYLHVDRAERDDGEKLPGAELLDDEDALGGSHEEVIVLDLCNVCQGVNRMTRHCIVTVELYAICVK